MENGILNYLIKNKTGKDFVNEFNKKDIFIGYNLKISLIEVSYECTLLSKKRVYTKYILDHLLIKQNTDSMHTYLKNKIIQFIDSENLNRKNKFSNVKLKEFKIIRDFIYLNSSKLHSYSNKYLKTKNKETYDVESFPINSLLDFLENKPSNNPKDYIDLSDIYIKIRKGIATYKVQRKVFRKEENDYRIKENTNKKQCLIISIEHGNLSPSAKLISTDYSIFQSYQERNVRKEKIRELISFEEISSIELKLSI